MIHRDPGDISVILWKSFLFNSELSERFWAQIFQICRYSSLVISCLVFQLPDLDEVAESGRQRRYYFGKIKLFNPPLNLYQYAAFNMTFAIAIMEDKCMKDG